MKDAHNFHIHLGRVYQEPIKERPIPWQRGLIRWANPEGGNLLIFLRPQAIQIIREHGCSDKTREVGGILIGEVYFCPLHKRHYVIIENVIMSSLARGSGTQVILDGHSWAEMWQQKGKLFPEKRIVGWYHTHPGFGIFLSPDDIQVQNQAFTQFYHIALVYDPVKDDFGLFTWSNGRISPAGGFYELLDEGQKTSAIVKVPEKVEPPLKRKVPVALMMAAVAGIVMLAFGIFTLLVPNPFTNIRQAFTTPLALNYVAIYPPLSNFNFTYYIGGEEQGHPVSSVIRKDLLTAEAKDKRMPNLNEARTKHAAVFAEAKQLEKAKLEKPTNGKEAASRLVDAPQAAVNTLVRALQQKVHGKIIGYIYVIGGEGKDGTILNSVERAAVFEDGALIIWHKETNELKHGLTELSAEVIGKYIFVGGTVKKDSVLLYVCERAEVNPSDGSVGRWEIITEK